MFVPWKVSWYSQYVPEKLREENLKLFVDGESKVLITTQALARGVPFTDVNLVINFNIPSLGPNFDSVDENIFINQISRCTQLNNKGYAISLTDSDGLNIDDSIKALGIMSRKM